MYTYMIVSYYLDKLRGLNAMPVFIVCQNRTGSTFLNKIFGEHPDAWTYRGGDHQEAMRDEYCPKWLRGQAFMTRWKIEKCPPIQRIQTKVWMAWMSRGHKYGVFKIPHALTKVLELQSIVPDMQFVLLVRNPYGQINSSLATDNPREFMEVTSNALAKFLKYQHEKTSRVSIVLKSYVPCWVMRLPVKGAALRKKEVLIV